MLLIAWKKELDSFISSLFSIVFRCKRKVPAHKQFLIHRAPNILTLQLKRYLSYYLSFKSKLLCYAHWQKKVKNKKNVLKLPVCMQLGVALTFCSWAEEIQFEQMAYPFFSLVILLPSCLPVFQLPCILELLHQAINNFIRNVKEVFRITLDDS